MYACTPFHPSRWNLRRFLDHVPRETNLGSIWVSLELPRVRRVSWILHSSNETPASSFNLSDQIVHSDGFQSECDPSVGGMTGCFSKALRPTDCFDKSQSSDTPNVSLPMLPAARVCSSRCCMGSRTCNSGSWKQWVLETASLSVPLKDRTSIVPRVYGLLPPESLRSCSCLWFVTNALPRSKGLVFSEFHASLCQVLFVSRGVPPVRARIRDFLTLDNSEHGCCPC